jgi:hypothetical protein
MNRFATITLLTSWSATAATLPQVPAAGRKMGDLDQNLFKCSSLKTGLKCRRQAWPADRIAEEPVILLVLFYREETLFR